MKAPEEVQRLVENFDTHLEAYKSGRYNETQVRIDYVNPLFDALGWDMDNKSGFPESYRDVLHEYSLKTADGTKAPDYCFRIGGSNQFFLETKKPSVHIKDDIGPAYQIRRYAWNEGLPLGILTDFEEFAVYDCHFPPRPDDKASVARLIYLTYKDYLTRWEEIAGIFSKEAIQKGAFDTFALDTSKKRTQSVDQTFLKDMEGWREVLARNIAVRNPKLSTKELNHLVQATIDRIVFLRICEDRQIEKYGRLQKLLKEDSIYSELCALFKQADDKYNSGLFHFKAEAGRGTPDKLSLSLSVDDKALREIIKAIYPPCPYVFSHIPADILGQVYEKFLGKVIRLTPAHQAKVEEKPEVRKAGGVYYTPKYIVDYIVKNTVGELLKNKTPTQAKKLRILDPACGSGSFLIGAYHYLLDWYCSAYAKEPDKHKKLIYKDAGNDWQLGTQEKKDILLKNIYGVDIDRQAVEVTKLSLLLKVLEGESKDTLQSQLRLFHERALPDLSNNIKCGNSLIGTDFFVGKNLELFDRDEMEKINAFDWDGGGGRANDGFADIMKAGGFDAVIGNPPYVSYYSRHSEYAIEDQNKINYLKQVYEFPKYPSSGTRFNTVMFFIEKSIALLNLNGLMSQIVDMNLDMNAFKGIREYILKSVSIVTIVRGLKAFEGVNSGQIIFSIKKSKNTNAEVTFKDGLEHIRGKIKQTKLLSNQDYRLDLPTVKLFDLNKTISLGNLLSVSAGVNIGGAANIFLETTPNSNDYVPFISTSTIKRKYQIVSWANDSYINFSQSLVSKVNKANKKRGSRNIVVLGNIDRFKCEKIFVRQSANAIVASYSNKICVAPYSIFVLNKLKNKYSIKFLLGILNSKLITSYAIAEKIILSGEGKQPQIRKSGLRKLPIINLTFNKQEKAQHDRMVQLVDQMLDTQKKLHASKSEHDRKHYQQKADILDKQIDALVYELYELMPEEIKIVEGADR